MSDEEPYRVVLLSKAGVGRQKREVLRGLAASDDIEVAGIVVEDMIHGSSSEYVRTLLHEIARRRGRGYPVRVYNAARDVFGTLLGSLPTPEGTDGDPRSEDGPDRTSLTDVSLIEVSDMLNEHARERIEALNPDLGIVWGTRILPPRIFDVPTDGSIGVHAGKIPEYRGGPAGFWELYHGEREAGVTVQDLNEELDARQIVRQETVPIGRGDSPADVRARQDGITADLVVEAVRGLKDGTLEPRDWDGEKRPVNTPPTIPQLVRFRIRQRGRRSVET